MLNFANDYMFGAIPEIMDALNETNMVPCIGYGDDEFCQKAKDKIRTTLQYPDAEIYFTCGGTQTNTLIINAILRPTQGVICAECGHINIHEAGAIEATGHKVIALPENNGKISASQIETYLEQYYNDSTHLHIVQPSMVYLTFPTEYGTLYSKAELIDIHTVCKKYNMPLFIDGARLGYGIAASNDIKITDIKDLCDLFYIGGTKQGCLIGEAIVAKPGLLQNFFSLSKCHGAQLAKGRLLGVQFNTLFENDLYLKYSQKAVRFAQKIRTIFINAGYTPFCDSPTNQQFFILPNELIERLSQEVIFDIWGPKGAQTSVARFVTSWATTEEDIKSLHNYLNRLIANL